MKLLSTQRLLPLTSFIMLVAIGVKCVALLQELPPLAQLPFQAADAVLAAGATVLPPAEAAKLPTRSQAGPAAAPRPATAAAQPIATPAETKPADLNPAAVAKAGAAPAALKPAEFRPADVKPADVKPADLAPSAAPGAPPATVPLQAASMPADEPAPAQTPPVAASKIPLTDADKALLEDLRSRRSQIEAREQALDQREATLGAAEKRLSERVAELSALQGRLQDLQNGLKAHDEANWQEMVKTYETMRPRDAAQIFNALDKKVLIEMVDRMKPAKVAPILAAMDPDRARMVTADVAARRTQSTNLEN
jgi:flagellar motility protein MotE (MotC chaperone)